MIRINWFFFQHYTPDDPTNNSETTNILKFSGHLEHVCRVLFTKFVLGFFRPLSELGVGFGGQDIGFSEIFTFKTPSLISIYKFKQS